MLADIDEQDENRASTRLLAAATEEFARRGFAGARIRSIVDAARVNQAAANYYFGGKQGLYRATLKHLAARLEPLEVPVPASGCPRARLHDCVVALLKRFAGTEHAAPLARILAHEAMSPSGGLDMIFEDALASEMDLLRTILRDASPGEIAPENLSAAAHGVLGQCVLYLHARSSIDRNAPAFGIDAEACEVLASQITRLAHRALQGSRRTPPGSEK